MNDSNHGAGLSDEATSDVETRWSQVAQRHYEPGGEGELTTTIVYAIAAAKGVAPLEVKSPPLYEVVDASAIEDAFFGSDIAGQSRQSVGSVEFHYTEYLVKVRSDGWVQVFEPAEANRS